MNKISYILVFYLIFFFGSYKLTLARSQVWKVISLFDLEGGILYSTSSCSTTGHNGTNPIIEDINKVEITKKFNKINVISKSYEMKGCKIQGLIVNIDPDVFHRDNVNNLDSLDEEFLIKYIDQYSNSSVTDIMLCVNTHVSSFKSKVRMDFVDKYFQKKENGIEVNYTHSRAAIAYKYYEVLGVDMFKVWIDHLRKNNINPWFSFRMNDTHHHTEKANVILSDYFHENVNTYSRILYRDNTIYRGDRSFDYSIKEVRNEMLAYIEEAVTLYDLYGIELDWMRDPIYTKTGYEDAHSGLLTQFMRDIKKIVVEAGEKWGHEIKISVRCPRDIQVTLDLGFDVLTWVAEGLIDQLTPSQYFYTDNTIPVETWKKILAPYSIDLVPSISDMEFSPLGTSIHNAFTYFLWGRISRISNNVETAAGTAASYFSQGADKVYIFNLYGNASNPISQSQKVYTDVIYLLIWTS